MNPHRRTTLALTSVLALGAGLLAVTIPGSSSAAPAAAPAAAAAKTSAQAPTPPPTKGKVTGRVIGPKGAPIKNALVMALRFSDFGAPIDVTEESRVLARTKRSGRFSLPQLTEPYLIRVCSEAPGSDGECATEPKDRRFSPTYVGPDGVTQSWLQQTRLFKPQQPTRAIGDVPVVFGAILTGRFRGGANQQVYLLRADDSVAANTFTDQQGDYRFEVSAGEYRVEVDRHQGLRTDSTVPGFRSGLLELRAGRKLELSFKARDAATVRGRVTAAGDPVSDLFIAILDKDEEFAAGVVTDGQGRYIVSSLKPGKYTVRTSATFSELVPVVRPVKLNGTQSKTRNLAMTEGATVRFSILDPTGPGEVDAELRNQAGRVVKVFQGDPADGPGGQVRWRGLEAGEYDLVVRRMGDPFADPEQTEFPWATQAVTLTATQNANLGVIALDQTTLNLSGTIPKGSQVKITPVPQDVWQRDAHIDGDQATPMATGWTEKAAPDGTYLSRGVVPGTYTVSVTTAFKNRRTPTTTGANVATRHHTLVVTPADTTENFSAPKGATVKGRMRYAESRRPVITPIGYEVLDGGDPSWIFPTVSGPQKLGRAFKVKRLHAGKAVGRILEEEGIYLHNPDVIVPDTLTMSSLLAEPGTPYWFTSETKKLRLKKGKVLNVGFVDVVLHGRAPVTEPTVGELTPTRAAPAPRPRSLGRAW